MTSPAAAERSRKNGRKGGRPLAAASVLSRRKANQIAFSDLTPLDVMHDNMKFWFRHVEKIAERIKDFIVNADSEEDRAEAFKLLRDLLASREKAQQCAVDMAPYCHPKLQAIAFVPEGDPKAADQDVPVDQVAAASAYQRLIASS